MHRTGELAQPFVDSTASTRALAYPIFALVVLCISLVIVQLFLAAVTFSFLTVRQSTRRQQHEEPVKKSFEDALDEAVAETSTSSDGQMHFPMHPRFTPSCVILMQSPKFDTFIAQTVVVNILVMAMNHYDMDRAN